MIEFSQLIMPVVISMGILVSVVMLYQNWKEKKPAIEVFPAIILAFTAVCVMGFFGSLLFEAGEQEANLMVEFCENPKMEGSGFTGYQYYCIFDDGVAREFTCNVKGCGWLE